MKKLGVKKSLCKAVAYLIIFSVGNTLPIHADLVWIDDENKAVVGHQSDYTHPYFEYYGSSPEVQPITPNVSKSSL